MKVHGASLRQVGAGNPAVLSDADEAPTPQDEDSSEGHEARALAGLLSFSHPDAAESDLETLRDALIVDVHRASIAFAPRKEQLALLLLPGRFRARWLATAQERLAGERKRHALSLFSESELRPLGAVAFAAALARKERSAALALLEAARLRGEPWGSDALDSVRVRLARRFLWESGVRALPVALLVATAAVALFMLLRVLKIPL